MDKVVSKIVAIGVPGLVLLVAMAASGWYGGAAIVTALAILGGPLGMLGGIALLGVLVLISNALAKYGFEKIFEASVKKYEEKGISREEIVNKIDHYPISRELKLKIKSLLQ
ncbi:MAG: hypothetical protein KAV00_13505 [Phycisphaerae bacterium]|nr:hypothetical protein [Phycisphaerae bacterium]